MRDLNEESVCRVWQFFAIRMKEETKWKSERWQWKIVIEKIPTCTTDIKRELNENMHLATEVSSTTQMNMDTCVSNASKSTNNINNNASSSSGNVNNNATSNSGLLTAETLAERTIDSLLTEHPGELVRTGCPHVVINTFYRYNKL